MIAPAQEVLGGRGSVAQPEESLVLAADVLTPVASQSLFWQAKYLRSAEFLQHLPFAFWLVQTCRPRVIVALGIGGGVGYFGFCQAVERLGLETACYGLDAWVDAQQAAEIFAYNEENYRDFSRLLDGDTCAGADRFPLERIDLLHVNLPLEPDFIEVLERDWLGRLSESGLILLHNLDRVLASKSARSFVKRISAEHSKVQFDHGEGLLLLLHGQSQPERLQTLASLELGSPGYTEVRRVFFRLGLGFHQEWIGREKTMAADAAEQRLSETEAARAAAEAAREAMARKHNNLKAAYDERMRMVGTLQARLFDLQSQPTVGEHLAELTRLRAAMEQALEAHSNEAARITAERDELQVRLAAETAEAAARDQTFLAQLAELKQTLETREAEAMDVMSELVGSVGRITVERDDLRTQLERRTTEVEALKRSQAIADRRSAVATELVRAHLRREADLKRSRWRYTWKPPLKYQIALLRDSDLFDADWYLETYKDLKGMSFTPEEHYIRHGACEGRNPGPSFDSMAYYIANPDVASHGMGALVHYLAFGIKEGRATEPAAL